MLLVQLRGLGLLIYRHLLSFFAIIINLGLSSIALSNYIHPQLSVLFTVYTIATLLTTRISIADLNLIGGARGVSSGEPLCLGTFGCEKIVLIFTVKNMLKFENF